MLTIKLARTGKPKQPCYRLLVTEKTKDPWGSYLEIVGNYNPRSKTLEAKKERITYWISKGAQPTDTVNNMLIKNGIIEGKNKSAYTLTKKRLEKINQAKAEAAKAAAIKAAPVETPTEAPVEN